MVARTFEARKPITLASTELHALEKFNRIIESTQPEGIRLVGPNEEVVDLPKSIYDILRRALPFLLEGNSVAIAPYHQELTTQEAADILNVSRQYLVQLCDEGKINHAKTGTHRRIPFADLMEYKLVRDELRNHTLNRLTRMSEELGLYDTPEPMPVEEPD